MTDNYYVPNATNKINEMSKMKFVKLSDKELKEIATFYQGVMATAYEGLFYREGRVIGDGILEMIPRDSDILEKAAKLIKARGWVDEVSFEEDKAIVKGSIEVNEESAAHTCHRLCGIIASVYEKAEGSIVDVKETRCESLGDDHCEFDVDKRGF